MIELKDITKDYKMASSTVKALRGVSVSFRDSEFVSILGPSGCGKTTLLNILGGLDTYTSGDMRIDSQSTKDYKDRDWDTYRNHKVGFVFQSYNLIPHQTVLENVELALNISGVKKEERIRRAKDVLERVGLKDQLNKKPNELSGGQCQRVAIARALINNPDILLADEPTGALDTQTSVQIMDLIKDIAKDTLVVMVTHNPELAEKYSTRLIKLLDGKIISDSNPYIMDSDEKKVEKKEKEKKSRLSLLSAIKLSGRNLWSKIKRTLMVCLTGSIGIIGVASVLSVSVGINTYIDNMQNDMLSGNPVTVQESTYDLSSIINMYSTYTQKDVIKNSVENGYINVEKAVQSLVNMSEKTSSMKVQNNIDENYVEFITSAPESLLSAYKLEYGIDFANNIYVSSPLTNASEGDTLSLTALKATYSAILDKTELKDYSYLATNLENVFLELPSNESFILGQYDIIGKNGTLSYPKSHNQIALVVNNDTELSDLFLAEIGYYTQEEFTNVIYKATGDDRYDSTLDKEKFSYEELLSKKLTYYPNNTIYSPNYISANTINPYKPYTYHAFKTADFVGGEELTISCILRPKSGLSYGSLKTGFYYTSALTEKYLQDNLTSDIAEYMNVNNIEGIQSGRVTTEYGESDIGVTYTFSFSYDGVDYTETGYLGSQNQLTALLSTQSAFNIPSYYTLSNRNVGGVDIPNKISLYSKSFEEKNRLLGYLDTWNSDGDITVNGRTIAKGDREKIKYTDNLSLVINMVGSMIDIVTSALVAFSALSLVVSTAMIAIITYVSVIERIKEIGVIRSLGGRKKDVARLFIAESSIIGFFAGVLGIVITGLIALLINTLAGMPMAILTPVIILTMIATSVLLTLISGLIPASLASKKDPVVALRSE